MSTSFDNPDPVISRYESYLNNFNRHLPDIIALHHRSLNELIPNLINSPSSSLTINQSTANLISSFLNDKFSLYRFLRRNRFNIDDTLDALELSIRWRLSSNIDFVSHSAIDPIYLDHPLLFFHPQLHDKWHRPVGVLNLKHLRRTEDGSLEGLKEFIAWNLEIARRYLHESSTAHLSQILEPSTSDPDSHTYSPPPSSSVSDPQATRLTIQFVLFIDLKDASMSNLEVELLPYLVELLKNNFPGIVGAIFIFNYGWMYAGMWQVAKRILPQQTLDRIFFPTEKDLEKFFDKSHLLVEHGGELAYKFDALQNHFIRRYGTAQPLSSTPAISKSDSISRATSMESLHDVYFSATNTPYPQFASQPGTPGRGSSASPHHPRPGWLSMTAFNPSTRLSPAELGEAMKKNELRRNYGTGWRLSDDFQLRLPQNTKAQSNNRAEDDEDESASQTSTTMALASPKSSFTSSSSLHEAIFSMADEGDHPDSGISTGRGIDWSASDPSRRIVLSPRHYRGCSSEGRNLSPTSSKRNTSSNLPREKITYRRRKRDYWYNLVLRLEYLNFKVRMILRFIIRFLMMRPNPSISSQQQQQKQKQQNIQAAQIQSQKIYRLSFFIGIILLIGLGRNRRRMGDQSMQIIGGNGVVRNLIIDKVWKNI